MSDSRTAQTLLDNTAPSAVFLGDGAYDSDALRIYLMDRGTVAAIPSHPRRAIPIPCDEDAYKGRNVVERAFSHLKDWRRIATRYDKLKETFQAAVAIAIICIWWAN